MGYCIHCAFIFSEKWNPYSPPPDILYLKKKSKIYFKKTVDQRKNKHGKY